MVPSASTGVFPFMRPPYSRPAQPQAGVELPLFLCGQLIVFLWSLHRLPQLSLRRVRGVIHSFLCFSIMHVIHLH